MTIRLLADSTKRRDKLVIMAEIMDIAKTGALKTQIMYRANLSFSQLNGYLKLLTTNKLLEKTAANGKDVYKATLKGKDFLARHGEIMELLCEENGNAISSPPENLLRKN